MAKNKPYNIPSKTTRKGTLKKKNVTRKIKDTIENTTKIRIDKDRLNDTSSLDTSFLEGRVDAQSRRKVLNSKSSNKKTIDLTILRNILLMVLLLVLLIITVLALMKHSTNEPKEEKVKEVEKEKIVTKMDNSYLFVGDSYVNNLNFEELDFHYIKISDDNYTTEDILNDIETIYRYNPSHIFIEVGMNDLKTGVEDNEIVTNISEIIDGIKENRPYAKIYLESIYPINTEMEEFDQESLPRNISNEYIMNINDMLKELSNDKKIEYLDIYKDLIEDEELNTEYTNDGVSLNNTGYEEVWNLIRKVVDKNGGKKN